MRPSSAKAKGRLLQQFVRDILLAYSPELEPDDVRSTSMGANGEDVLLSPAARKRYPWHVECKNVEKLNIWESIRQARSHGRKYVPIVIFTKNREDTYIALPIDYFMEVCYAKEDPGFFVSFGRWADNWISSWTHWRKSGIAKGRSKVKGEDTDSY